MSRAGIKQLVLCSAGTLYSGPSNVVMPGLRNGAVMEITPFKTIKDYRNRELPNMDNIKIETETLQPSLYMLKHLAEFANHNCDVQVLSSKQNASGAGSEAYIFTEAAALGLDFELLYTHDKRSIKITLERAYPEEQLNQILTGMSGGISVTIPGLQNSEGVDYSKYRMPYTMSIESPEGAVICSDADFEARKLSIKTKSRKNARNSSVVDYISVNVELETRDASINKLIQQRGKGISPAFVWKESNGNGYYDAFKFDAGVLSQRQEFKNNDELRIIKIIYGAEIPLYDLAFEFGAGKGGDETDTAGVKGGTVHITQ